MTGHNQSDQINIFMFPSTDKSPRGRSERVSERCDYNQIGSEKASYMIVKYASYLV